MNILLSKSDIEALTGYKRPSYQIDALRQMGVRYRIRPDGAPVVAASDIDGKPQRIKPRLDLVTAKTHSQ